MTKIELEGVEKSFLGRKVLDDVSFTVESGAFVSILGAANAGKTTLLRIIAGTLKPDKGRVFFDGKDVTNIPPQKRNVGVIFQSFALYPNMSVYDNIASPLRVGGLPRSEVDKKVMEMASLLRIKELLEKSPYELSGGEAQRVALGRALVKDAAVYLLDEPLTNLDYKLRESMKVELKKILSLKKTTIIYATPSPEEALVLTDKLIFLENGRVIQTGRVKECYENPVNVTAARRYSTPPMNLLDAILMRRNGRAILSVSGKLELDATHLNLPEGETEYIVGVYPYNIYLTREGEGMVEIPSDLELQELAGSEMTIRIKWNDSTLTMYVPYEKILEKKIMVYVNPSDFYIFSKSTGALITKYRRRE
ncbi:MAG: ABC transporter ATP-binding protein [Candidatus Bathyarchaeia archaeon]|nr:ABC transporter ATP-binding protein [Candidatus Bathyarchaeota archaeon]